MADKRQKNSSRPSELLEREAGLRLTFGQVFAATFGPLGVTASVGLHHGVSRLGTPVPA
jgi:hypothetical protein